MKWLTAAFKRWRKPAAQTATDTRRIVVCPAGDRWAVEWMGLSATDAALLLYEMADNIVAQKIPQPSQMLH